MLSTTFLSHFAQMCGKAKERFENDIEFPFDGSWFFQPTDQYNPYMSWSGMAVCLSGYKNLPSNNYQYIHKSFVSLGCEDIDISTYYHRNDENHIDFDRNVDLLSYAFGHRMVSDGKGNECLLLIMMLRGTSDTNEWLSNSEVADGISDGDYSKFVNHEGFWNSAHNAMDELKTYIAEHKLDMSNAKLWMIGHSRGAAVGNALAAMIDEDTTLGVTKDRFYSYNYSASRTTMREDYDSEKFNNIFNVINPEDYIPRLPPYGWGIRRFGRDLYLPSIATRYADYRTYRKEFLETFKAWTRMDFPAFHGNAETNALEHMLHSLCPDVATMYQKKRFSHAGTVLFTQYFTLFTDLAAVSGNEQKVKATMFAKYGSGTFEDFLVYFLHNEILGHNASGAHQEEGYLIKLALCCKYNIDIEQGANTDVTRVTAYGPVDIQVNDANGKVVALIEHDKISERLYNDDDFLAMYIDDKTGERSVWVPDTGEYVVSMRAEQNGNFDVLESKIHPLGHTVAQKVYANVAFTKNVIVNWNVARCETTGVDAKELNTVNARVSVQGIGKLNDDECFSEDYIYGACNFPVPGKSVVCDALGYLNASYGDHAVVQAHRDAHTKFLGWYEKDHIPGQCKPISTQEKTSFPLTGDVELVAWFDRR